MNGASGSDPRRWARPEDRGAAEPDHSPAAAWVRSRPPLMPADQVGLPERVLLPDTAVDEGADPSGWPAAAGAILLAGVACLPHWVAPTVALIVAMVGLPIAWAFVRTTSGRSRIRHLVALLTLAGTVVLAVVAPLIWLRAGVLAPIDWPWG